MQLTQISYSLVWLNPRFTTNLASILTITSMNLYFILFSYSWHIFCLIRYSSYKGRHGRDRMVVVFKTTYLCNHCLSPLKLRVRIRSWRGVLYTALCDKVCQWLAAGRYFSSGTLVSSTNKTDRHDITEILLKVALNNATLTSLSCCLVWMLVFCCCYILI